MRLRNSLLAAGVSILLAGGAMAQADEARAKKIVGGVCFLCHGAQGESSSEVFPRLAGQHWEYVAKQLDNFKSGKRKSSAMADMSAKLTPDEMVALGRYFEKQPWAPSLPRTLRWPLLAVTSTTTATSTAAWPRVPVAMVRVHWEPTLCHDWPVSSRATWKASSSSSTNASVRMTTP
jgi:cytochrome c553